MENKPENPFQNYDVAKKYKEALIGYEFLKDRIEKHFQRNFPSRRVT